jgi:hypothetical protein
VTSISSNIAAVSGSSNLGYLDLNWKLQAFPGITVETSQGLNFIHVEGNNHTDNFQLLGTSPSGQNNQIWVDNSHITSSGQVDTFVFYDVGANSGVPAALDTVPHITATDVNGFITIGAAENLTGNALTPNTGVATIYGFEADNTNNHNDQIQLTGFTFNAGTNPNTQQALNLTNLITNSTDLTDVTYFFHNALSSSGQDHGAAYYIVQNGYSSIQHPRDVFLFVDENHDGNFTAGVDLAVQLINTSHDITLSTTNFA